MTVEKSGILKRIHLIFLILLFASALSACSGDSEGSSASSEISEETAAQAEDSGLEDISDDDSTEASISFESMDTYMTITVYGTGAESVAAIAQEEIERLDGILSAESEGSEIYEINAAGGGTLSGDAAYLVDISLQLWEATGGAFDISVYPVAQLWGFTTGDYAVPSDEELAQTLELVGTDMLLWDSASSLLTLEEGMAIGLGGIAKGYSGDQITEIFEAYGVDGAIASLGGNIVVYGTKPSGDPWKVAIQDPADSSGYACVLSIDYSANIITSGGYERYFEEDGVTYHHIIDPSTGYPADAGLTSVSIITANGTEGDGLSTSLFVMGLEAAIEFWQTTEDYEFEMVLVDSDGVVYISEGLADSYTSDCEVVIISK